MSDTFGQQNTVEARDPRRASERHTRGQISKREINFRMPTNLGKELHVQEIHGDHHWRQRTLKFLHAPGVQTALMLLLFFDVLILFVEVFLLAQYPPCVVIERDAISCCPVPVGGEVAGRWVMEREGDGGHHEEFCEAGLEADPESPAGCDPHKWSNVHTAEDVLFGLTITILSTFMVELNVEMIALGPCVFFRQFFFLLDYVIITVSLALEIVLHSLSDDSVQALVGLLVFVRIWRFVRIGHGIAEITNEVVHKDHEKVISYTEKLEELVKSHGIPLPEDSEHNPRPSEPQ
eukprot:CAMPEP_0174892840 /NCGR_PEP_ID=MMETSP0167-20121228/7740_1 /TAXON_ID=38298 /ORGANISM="Rhodella maculata, Strain CCMP736" /LENGTH=291 /DNA_ID=CAMNT_0016131453 /DNA_START=100 /DNA_END=975 /DNA_ORIENTATION=+